MKMDTNYAILSGLCAACASAFGKLSGLEIFAGWLIIKAVLFVAMLVCNAAVWTLFVKALHQSDSTLIATIISSTANYLFTVQAFLGYFLLGEVTSTFWWTGMIFNIIGLTLIVSDDSKSNTSDLLKEQ